MPVPLNYDDVRYLAAKKSVDDRALNRRVWDRLARALAEPGPRPLQVLEVGAGIGTMVERLLEKGVLPEATYTALDIRGDYLAEARRRLRRFTARQGLALTEGENGLLLSGPGLNWRLNLETRDIFDLNSRKRARPAFDLLIAHAFLDLVDLASTLPLLFSWLRPGGLFYFSLNFDGATILRPPLDPEFDDRVEALYHESMDRRRVQGRPAGSSRTGRRLPALLRTLGARVLARGRSDWRVSPHRGRYPADEAYFLHFILHTIHQALKEDPRLEGGRLAAWIAARQAQVERGELTYLARQWDYLGTKGN